MMNLIKQTSTLPFIISGLSALLLSSTANAFEAGDIIVRAGVAHVAPSSSSSNVSLNGTAIAGTGVNVDSDTQLGIVGTYMLKSYLGVSVLASTPFDHDIRGNDAVGIDRIGTAKQLPPTVTLDYFPLKSSNPFQVHFGLGLNYTRFFSDDTESEFDDAFGSSSLDLDDSFGLALKAGFDYQINDKFGINATVYRIDIDTDATINTASGSVLTVDVDIDPYVYIIGASYKF